MSKKRQLVFVLFFNIVGLKLAAALAASADLTMCPQLESSFVAFKGEAYLCASHIEQGKELFRTNGTSRGTKLIADIDVGAGSSNPGGMFELNGNLFFLAESSINGVGLWRTRVVGSENETKRIKTIDGSDITELQVIYRSRNYVIFRAGRMRPDQPTYSEADTSRTLWRTDGTSNGTYRLDPKIFEGAGSSFSSVVGSSFLATSDRLYYTTLNSLYRFNILTEKSTLIKTFQLLEAPEELRIGLGDYELRILGNASGSEFYFQFGESLGGRKQLWISDGTNSGTSMLQSNINAIGAFGGKVIACQSDGANLLVIDQFESKQIFTVNTRGDNCSNVIGRSRSASIEGRYIFEIFDDSYGFFSTDLTPEGSFGLEPVSIRRTWTLGVTNSKMIYAGSDNGIYSTDGSALGAKKIATANAFVARGLFSTVGSYASPIIPQANFQIFQTQTEGNNRELWKTDGTPDGTMKLKNLPQGHQANYIGIEGLRRFFFVSDLTNNLVEGSVIWHSDGTTEGSYKLSYQIDDQPVSVPLPVNETFFLPSIQLLLEDETTTFTGT